MEHIWHYETVFGH